MCPRLTPAGGNWSAPDAPIVERQAPRAASVKSVRFWDPSVRSPLWSVRFSFPLVIGLRVALRWMAILQRELAAVEPLNRAYGRARRRLRASGHPRQQESCPPRCPASQRRMEIEDA